MRGGKDRHRGTHKEQKCTPSTPVEPGMPELEYHVHLPSKFGQ
jgi:hypothetical protein